jgi:hypothetical protein
MHTHNEEDFEFQEPESEEIDVWDPVLTEAEDSDIQLPQDYTVIHTIGAEEVKVWMAVNQELMRQEITRQLMRLYTISFLVGLAIFAFTQNIWLLTASGLLPLLPLLIRWIVGYWFRPPKK